MVTAGKIFRIFLPVFLILASVSCSEPDGKEKFVRQNARGSDGSYCFTVDFSDSLCRYTMSFYTMADVSDRDFADMPKIIPLSIRAVSPSGRTYAETVGLDKDSHIRNDSFSKQYESVYRRGFSPVEYGEWTIMVTIPGEARFQGLRGLGLKYVKEENGKR